MRSVLNFVSMLALGLMIAAVIMVAPAGTGGTSIAGFEIAGPLARLPLGHRRARHRHRHRDHLAGILVGGGASRGSVDGEPGAAAMAHRLGGAVPRHPPLLLSAALAAGSAQRSRRALPRIARSAAGSAQRSRRAQTKKPGIAPGLAMLVYGGRARRVRPSSTCRTRPDAESSRSAGSPPSSARCRRRSCRRSSRRRP